ncbi:MAG: hypothetical protein CVU62_13935 [Deltaproteobacteria bacterium HGW-Deltaproteobacteria-2]|jgi:Cu/Ag efflux protein CusF|nr:MAG: hypothetical protein CVU62_13935 [Deltaproteobacteria bacterium HGW-Deltaproteobacteria-2]
MTWKTLNTTMKLIVAGIFIVALLAVASAFHSWFADKPTISQSEYAPAKEIKKAIKIEHKKITVHAPIDVLDKDEAVKKLKINDPVKSDKNKQITTTAEIQPYDGKTSVISVLDTSTGMSEIIAKQEPLSFFGFENKKELGVRVGYSTDEFEMRSTVFGRWQFLRVGNFHLGVYGEANSRGEGIGQLEISYKF